MKRIFDVLMSLLILSFVSIPLLFIALLVKFTSNGPIIYWSDRVGKNNAIFKMPKFRTMFTDTPIVATHLLNDSDMFLTPVGKFLRKSSLDELPQLYSVLKGDMSIVGPRPALFNQYDLVNLRIEHGVHLLAPGITGWAQVNGRDELPISVKVEFDAYYLLHQSLMFDMRIMLKTIHNVIMCEGVMH